MDINPWTCPWLANPPPIPTPGLAQFLSLLPPPSTASPSGPRYSAWCTRPWCRRWKTTARRHWGGALKGQRGEGGGGLLFLLPVAHPPPRAPLCPLLSWRSLAYPPLPMTSGSPHQCPRGTCPLPRVRTGECPGLPRGWGHGRAQHCAPPPPGHLATPDTRHSQ